MESIIALVTGSTCGDNCWSAREEICRCSCGGANHGCVEVDSDGTRPQRTCRIQRHVYRLIATGTYSHLEGLLRRVFQHCRDNDIATHSYSHSDYRYVSETVAIRKAGTRQQVESWPELAAAKDVPFNRSPRDLLWLRDDLADEILGDDNLARWDEEIEESHRQYQRERDERRAALAAQLV